ncbi:MAG: HAMP domain-containing protein [Deltaproteobacteria bacterium]|nr:MAG: HAMP domain-containing protein [Deltaproteobacteria bacterium]
MQLRVRSLATKVILLSVGISAILAAGLTFLGYRKAARGLRSRTETALAADSSLTANLIDSWMRERMGSLRALGRLGAIRRALETAASPAREDLEATDRALTDGAALAPDIESIGLVNLAGKVIRTNDGKDEGRDLSQREYVRDALGGNTFITGVSVREASGKPAIFFAAPILGSNGTVIGAAYIRASTDPVRSCVEAAKNRLGPGAHGILLDNTGLVVETTIDANFRMRPIAGAAAQPPVLQARRSWDSGASPAPLDLVALGSLGEMSAAATTNFLLDGVQQLAVAQPLKNAKWVYIASLPMSEVERSAREFLRTAIAGALLGLAVATGLALFFARGLTRSLKRLTEASERVISDGDLSQRIEALTDDEIGRLGRTFARMVEALREALTTLKASAGSLADAALKLRSIMDEQSQFIASQATALQQTQVTAQEIKQTSALAAEKAQAVLQVAERADEIGGAGERAVARSLGGLSEIGKQAREVGDHIQKLSERARQIGGITMTVKDLADQSNMLALNAAIEAVRSGEHGRSFAVVAREIRSLADQSIKATNDVGGILQELTSSIGTAVSLTEASTKRMEAGIVEVTSSGDNLRALSGITRENVAAVRQIAAAVSQQNAGISQIFAAVTDQMALMDRVRDGLQRTQQASEELREVAARVGQTLERYRL